MKIGRNWLLIFDNADDLDMVKRAWPRNSVGSILITSRDSNAAFTLASNGCQIKPFDTQTGSAALLNFIGIDQQSDFNQLKAMDITATLGGLPLALSQIGAFIVQRKVPLQNFLALYERNAVTIDSKNARNTDYDHTLATVWEMSLHQLSGNARALHMLLAFLDPDCIQEALLKECSNDIKDPNLHFLKDEIEYVPNATGQKPQYLGF